MFQYDAFITLDFQKILPAVKDIFTGIFQLIQLRNLGTKYWIQWFSQKVGVWGKQCLV